VRNVGSGSEERTAVDDEAADRRERAARLARRAVNESRRAIKMVSAQAAGQELIDEALEILELVRSLSPDDPLAEALAVHLLLSSKSAIALDAGFPSPAGRRGTPVPSTS
jgi:hypothetical protein